MAILIDAAIVAVFIFITAHGAKRGLILSLFGFLGALIALFGAIFAVGALAPRLEAPLRDTISTSVAQKLETLDLSELGSMDELEENLVQILVDYGMQHEAAESLVEMAQEAITDPSGSLLPDAAADIAAMLAEPIAAIVVFLAVFVLLLVLCHLLARLIDTVFQLPVLRQCNALLGALFGAAKATALIVAFVWLLGYAGDWLPRETVGQTHILRWLMQRF